MQTGRRGNAGGGGWGNSGDGSRCFDGRIRDHDTLTPSGFLEARTGGCVLCERFFDQLVVNKTQRRGEEGRFPSRHSLDVIH